MGDRHGGGLPAEYTDLADFLAGSPVLAAWDEFVDVEMQRFQPPHQMWAQWAFNEVQRYYLFLRLLRYCHRQHVTEFLEVQAELIRHADENADANGEQARIFGRFRSLWWAVQCDVESAYLFAKTLLDRTANALGRYFGEVRGVSFLSHDDLRRGLDKLEAAGFTVAPTFRELLERLQADIVQFRDKRVQHLPSVGSHAYSRSLGIHRTSGRLHLGFSKAAPNPTYDESRSVDKLLADIDDYLPAVQQFMQANASRAALTGHRSGSRPNLSADSAEPTAAP